MIFNLSKQNCPHDSNAMCIDIFTKNEHEFYLSDSYCFTDDYISSHIRWYKKKWKYNIVLLASYNYCLYAFVYKTVIDKQTGKWKWVNMEIHKCEVLYFRYVVVTANMTTKVKSSERDTDEDKCGVIITSWTTPPSHPTFPLVTALYSHLQDPRGRTWCVLSWFVLHWLSSVAATGCLLSV